MAVERKASDWACHDYLHSAQTGLPCVDPILDGVAPIIDPLLQRFPQSAQGVDGIKVTALS